MPKNAEHLICFDLDGTLISSMAIANQIFYDTVHKELGLPLYDYPRQKTLMALSAEERMETLWKDEMKERGITPKQVAEAIQAYRDRKMQVSIPLIPHAAEAVRLMADNFEFLACVSSNPDYMIEETLQKIGLRPYFALVVGMDQVEFSKPHPAIYLQAVSHYGFEPRHCVTFEDSTPGLQSAKAAGLKTIAVATGLESIMELEQTAPNLLLGDLSAITVQNVLNLF